MHPDPSSHELRSCHRWKSGMEAVDRANVSPSNPWLATCFPLIWVCCSGRAVRSLPVLAEDASSVVRLWSIRFGDPASINPANAASLSRLAQTDDFADR